MDIQKGLNTCLTKTTSFVKQNSPTIMTILSIGGLAATVYFTVKGTKDSESKKLERQKEHLINKDEADKKEEVLDTAKAYAPAAVSAIVTCALIIGSNVISKKQQATLVGAYSLLSYNYKRYRDTVTERYGKEVDHDILRHIEVEKAKNVNLNAPSLTQSCSLDIDNEHETPRLFWDSFSERYFESTMSRVIQAQYHLNRNFTLGQFVTLNDFYEFLGISKVDGGDDIGWYWNDCYQWIDFFNEPAKVDDMDAVIVGAEFPPQPEVIFDI